MKRKHFKLLMILMIVGMASLLCGQTITIDLGEGTDTNTTTGAAPFNIFYKSLRSQSVYTATEINETGFGGPATLEEIGFYVTDPPIHALPNFIIRVKHTTANDASNHDNGPFETVYTNPSLMPVGGDWFMMTFTTDFEWNGADNILIDTAFGLLDNYNSSGQLWIYDAPNGMRYGRSDSVDQTNEATTTTTAYKPQIRMVFDGGSFIQDDMAATAINGPTSPSIGNTYDYVITVRNIGAVTQDNYTIKLMQEGDIEIDSVVGTQSLEQSETADYTLSWTPSVEGPTYLYGEVILANDENPGNDTTDNLNVTVMPSGVNIGQIGTGTETNTTTGAAPVNIFYRSLRTQTVYTAAELNTAGIMGMNNILGLAYHVTSPPIHPLPNFKIRMRHTTATDASAHIDGPYEEVYITQSFMPTAGDWELLPFSVPFQWNGVDNILVDTTFDMVTSWNSSGQQLIFNSPNGMRYVRSDGSNQGNEITTTTADYKPQVQLSFQPLGETGSLTGNVYDQLTSDPIEDADVEILGVPYTMTTDNQGYFNFPYVPIGEQTVEITKHGYIDYETTVMIIEDENTNITVNMELLPNVTVSGQVVGSDYPAIGLEGGIVTLSGYEYYETTTGTDGMFSLPYVISNQTYNINVIVEGYSPYTATVEVENIDLDLGVIIVDEVAYPPHDVVATQSADDTYVDLIWNTPIPVSYYFSDFEDDDGGWEPTADWDPIGDWEWSDEYDVNDWVNTGSTSATPPPYAQSGTGMWGTVMFTNHTNSGGSSFLSQTFDFTTFNDASLIFWSWNDSFGNFDYGQIWVNDQLVWGPEWDYTNTTWQEVVIDLSAWDGESEVEIVFEHYASTVVNYAGWYIDDVFIGPVDQYPERGRENLVVNNPNHAEMFSDLTSNRSNRVLENYRVYRVLDEDAGNEDNWEYLGTATDTTYTDNGWATVDSGFYRYGVKAEHTNEVVSDAAISNWVGKDMTTNVTVNITTNDGSSAAGAVVTMQCLDEDPEGNSPAYELVAVGDDPSVAEFFNVLIGDYDLTVALAGYETYTQTNIPIQDVTEIDVQVNEIPFAPSNVIAEINQDSDVDLTWGLPGTGVMTEFRYDDGVIDEQLGFQGGTANGVMGSVHRNDAQIHEVTWITTEEGGPHNAVNLFIFGLDATGMPNANDLLYQSMNVPNTDLEWMVYELPDPIDAPNGFMIGLSYTGFLGLATDDGLGDDWPFMPNTHFYAADYTTNTWSTVESAGFNVNFMLRAYGYDYGELRHSGNNVASNRDLQSLDSRPAREQTVISEIGRAHV